MQTLPDMRNFVHFDFVGIAAGSRQLGSRSAWRCSAFIRQNKPSELSLKQHHDDIGT